MTQETHLRLPGRLRSVIRADGAAPALPGSAAPLAVPPPKAPPAPNPEQLLLERLLASFAQEAQAFQARLGTWLKDMKRTAVDMAIAVAEQILHQRIEAGEFPYQAVLEQALERLAQPRQALTISLHPQDAALVRRLMERHELNTGSAAVVVQERADLPRGSVLLETAEQRVEANVQDNLAWLRQNLAHWAAQS